MLSDKDLETETYFGFCKNDTRAYMYSADTVWIRKMRKWATDHPAEVIVRLDNKNGTEVELPVDWFTICPPKVERKKRTKKTTV